MNVTVETLKPGQKLPLIVRPQVDVSAADTLCWIKEKRDWLIERVKEHGGLLLRGWGLKEASDFEAFTDAMGFELMEYIRGNTPRTVVRNKVYTSTEIRRFVPIPLHNEMSYTAKYPRLIAFLCHTRAPVGGQTPIADMHQVWANIPPRIRDVFAERQLKYTHILGRRPKRFMKKTWTEMFNTEDRAVVERHCADQGIDVEWGKRDMLRLSHVRPAVIEHPDNGQPIWFNQAHIFHPSFSSELRRFRRPAMAFLLSRYERYCRRFNPDAYPYNCTYGDGGVIPPDDIDEIRDVLWNQAITFDWQQRDLVLLDNIRVAHSRLPYKGPRLVLTALIQSVQPAPSAPRIPLQHTEGGAEGASGFPPASSESPPAEK